PRSRRPRRRPASISRRMACAGLPEPWPPAIRGTRSSTPTRRTPSSRSCSGSGTPTGRRGGSGGSPRRPPAPGWTRPRPPPRSRLDWLAPRPAHADDADEWRDLSERLDRWVPTVSELVSYREIVDRLLTLAAERSFDGEAIGERFDDLFRDLVKTVAWQESCW